MQRFFKVIKEALSLPFLLVIYFYKYAISPLTPASCRHYPTCSEYSLQAIKRHGPFKGGWLSVKRILSCHPWGSGGIDPVPRIIIKKMKIQGRGKTERLP